jgi:orotidine-5'-phosphate decarboxylase
MARIVKAERSIVPTFDVYARSSEEAMALFNDPKEPLIGKFRDLIKLTHDVEGVGAYKINAALAIRYGLPRLVGIVREYSPAIPIIYDHQKGMTDIPDTGMGILAAVKSSGVDAFIGFPQAGPATQEAWTKAAQDLGLEPIIGGEMTHPKYKRSEGGYISDDALAGLYLLGARMGVTNFVVPGSKLDRVAYYLSILQKEVKGEFSLWAPGFVAQGGSITEAGKAAGKSFHAIVGRGITEAEDMHAAAIELASQLGR